MYGRTLVARCSTVWPLSEERVVIVRVFLFFCLSVFVLGHSKYMVDSDGAWNACRFGRQPGTKRTGSKNEEWMTNQAKKLAAKLAEKQGRYVEMREASGEAGRADHMRDRQ